MDKSAILDKMDGWPLPGEQGSLVEGGHLRLSSVFFHMQVQCDLLSFCLLLPASTYVAFQTPGASLIASTGCAHQIKPAHTHAHSRATFGSHWKPTALKEHLSLPVLCLHHTKLNLCPSQSLSGPSPPTL